MIKQSNRNQAEIDAIRKIRSGDREAFKQLFFEYYQPLLRFANRYVPDLQQAEDILQDVFFKIWEKRSEPTPRQNIKAYLYTAVRNHALNCLRHARVRRRASNHLVTTHPKVKTPEDLYREDETEAAVRRAIERLPQKSRIIFSMNRFDGLTYAEIARIQNISMKTVETHIVRALKSLRKQLSHII